MKLTLTRSAKHSEIRDPAILKKHVHKQIVKLWKRCVGEFVKEVSKHVAIDTGMSMASLMPLAAKVRLASFLRSKISGMSKGHKKGYTDKNFQYHPDRNRSKTLGERLGSDAYNLSFGSPLSPDLTFSFDIVVLQYWLHESKSNYSGSGHWQSIKKGERVFLRTWKALYGIYVNPKDINTWILTGVWHSAF